MLNRIRVVLAEKDIRSSELAKMLNVSKTTVSTWVNNKGQPSVEKLFRIAIALNVEAGR